MGKIMSLELLINKELVETVRKAAEEDEQKHELISIVSHQKRALEEMQTTIEELRSEGGTDVFTVNIRQVED